MGFFSKIFGVQDLESQKRAKFEELERQFAGTPEMVNFTKATWLTSRGNHYGQQNQLDQATADFKEAITLNPNHTPAYISLGLAYREKRMFKEAIAILEKAPRESKVYGDEAVDQRSGIYLQLGLVYMVMGDKEKAIEHLEESLEANEEMRHNPKTIEQQEFLRKIGTVGKQEEVEHEEMVDSIKELVRELKSK